MRTWQRVFLEVSQVVFLPTPLAFPALSMAFLGVGQAVGQVSRVFVQL